MTRPSTGGWRAKLVLVALGVACLYAASLPVLASGKDDTPIWERKSYPCRGWDRTLKLDIMEQVGKVPRVVVYGGSRGLRMDPATIKHLTGLNAFNFAFHNGRPEDAWATTNYLIRSNPDRPPAVVWCLQATTLADVPMAPGLIVDERLSQAFPKKLIDSQMDRAMSQPIRNALSGRRYGPDGMLWYNSYDKERAQGITLQMSLNAYLDSDMLARAGNGVIPHRTRAQQYFQRTLKLLNANHIKPVLVIMPYHPQVLDAFMRVGWGVKEAALRSYLKSLHKYFNFRVLDCLDISTFGGSRDGFYDGAHLTAANSRLLIRYIVRKAPECFRVPKPTPTPSPSVTPSPSSSPSPSPAAAASGWLMPPPPYMPVFEETAVPADFLE